ncbi:cytochrome c oxidase accessory protein CcoG [Bradyrhizobium sp. 83002]|uniref:cytochrome c oxidase accessory protein CcoG n=1 Tax=Bradyrhizobium aeschynomenes TaxID=2734909 RepID=UPI001554574F|nr:cytochrome c oxidase accessory protein CcoG [Bradyrhizobium aeschynomenes]NPU11633.1 cytochrome c oxidase accessory protein CcoG [Bradyrhizobium aeschynomenes]
MAITIEIDHARTRRMALEQGQSQSPAQRLTPVRKPARSPRQVGGPVVPQGVKGPIRRLKWLILVLTLGVYYITPFLRWDRGPNAPEQAVLLDFAHGRLYLGPAEIWPQDLYLITAAMLLATFVLVLVNALAGRLWCGFACPQTVWTDLFLLVERLVEGDRRQRLKNIGAPLTAKRIAQIVTKHALWIMIALGTGGTLIFYFTDAPELVRDVLHGEMSATALTWTLVFAGTTYGLAGFAREQVCTFMCPWPRLQGAIWDPEAFTVNYRDYRGEVRMSAKKAAEARALGEPAGDCVDCGACVAVCPIGIDIRQGPNFACINCGLCVDACDSVMAKLDRPRGLIDYESWRNIERGRAAEPRVSRLVRPKTIGLALACVTLAAVIAVSFVTKTTAVLSVQHDRDPLSVRLSDGSVRNAYTVKLLNKSSAVQSFKLGISGVEAALAIIGHVAADAIEVEPDGSETLRVTLTMFAPVDADVTFKAVDATGQVVLSAHDRFVKR